MFDVRSCMTAANAGRMNGWVARYLSAEHSAVGFREGLRFEPRHWIGPLLIPLNRLERSHGPEQAIEFPVNVDAWQRRVSDAASGLTDPMDAPPLLVEWRAGRLVTSDGNHRHAAMVAAGWNACWVLVGCNGIEDYDRARQILDPNSSQVIEQRLEQLRKHGWALFPAAVSKDLVAAASRAIRDDLASNYDSDRRVEYENISYCPDLRRSAQITELLTHSSAKTILDRMLVWEETGGRNHGQIAIRWGNRDKEAFASTPHIDGIPNGNDGLVVENGIENFTALVGVFLTRADVEFAGSLTVWPGSHIWLETYFRNRGPRAMHEGQPPFELSDPVQLLVNPGDMVVCHYLLVHAPAANVSPNDRLAVYFRLWSKEIRKRRWEYLTDMWKGWRL
jgi:ectoine hydroxylase-related dioxygenase (phytanoyl-CoA dioxygenase family)